MTGRRIFSLVCTLWLLASPARAGQVELIPLRVSNQAPLARLCGLPSLDRARLLEQGQAEVSLSWDLASSYTQGASAGEAVLFDGESHRVALRYDRGLSGGWEAGLEIPLIMHREGFLDGFIEGWHDVFQLPQGGRDSAPHDRLGYLYVVDGNARFALLDEQTGLGDLRLLLSRQLTRTPASALSLHAALELPTGDEAKLLGSGSVDAALWLSGDRRWDLSGSRLAFHWGGGVLLADRGELLADQRRRLAGTGNLGIAWSPLPPLVLQVQLDAHTSLFDSSSLRQIDKAAAQLAIGGALALGEATRLELAVSEDISVDTAPDVTFHLLLARRL